MNLTTYDTHFLIAAIIIISLALVLYTVGVWGEKIQKGLRGWHVAFFLMGICADVLGTSFMAELVRLTGQDNRLHEITGLIAVTLMAIHAVWAVMTYWKGTAKARRRFSRFSILVWCIWLVPYFIGVYLGTVLHQ